ncbi:porin family protein [Flavobacterium gilvum]|uniref:Outer membrane protein beta-barrel domain-containing protein n=1 Tax=Flavobacterium gilvum TaxID=1492737 RepID=A0AAC9I245_9FLAO|nr:porin family protein [Flavobacterium gilvum]AOW08761.1 hypothetical protein EM308_04170 [Flavobacterium gilvum]KFC60043.1 hypothetical protein FEM08_12220 [Flavobacterium gilvum]
MKKTLLTLISLVSFGFANSQIKEKGTFEMTPKIGFSRFSEVADHGDTNQNSGVEFGVTTDYYFSDRWSLRSGLIFDKMGGEYSATAPIDYIYDMYSPPQQQYQYYEDKLHYLSIPINANWHFGSTRKWNLNFGLSPSFLLDAKVNNTEMPKNSIESFQLGLTFGIGYKIEITQKFGILVDFQGFAGMTNINKSTPKQIANSGSSFNIGGVFDL